MSAHEKDRKYMQMALRLAHKGAGRVSPNPLVGAVIVRDGRIIGRGYHEQFGGPHAEINAIRDAGGDVNGATLYCTLEPCSHTGKKTPPCAQRLVKEKIRRVVVAATDPNPAVNGAGIAILQKAGITVETGVLEEKCREMNRFFFKYVTSHRPYVMVKIAQTIDGFIALDRTRQTWITNPEVRRRVHRWRSEFDAVLVGIGTVKSDDPELTVRDIAGRNPVRVLIDRDLEVSPAARILRNAAEERIVIFTSGESAVGNAGAIKKTGAEVVPVILEKNGRLAMRSILEQLHGWGVASVMVEGGQKIFTQTLSQDLADELQIFMAPVIWGSGIRAVAEKADLNNFSLISSEKLSDNLLVTFRRNG